MRYMLFNHNVLPNEYKKQLTSDMDNITRLNNAYVGRGRTLQQTKQMMNNMRF